MNCLFFEVSAKTEENIKKLLYSSIIELPMFEKYRKNKVEDLIFELEQNNNDSKLNASGLLDSGRINNELNISSDRESVLGSTKNKCNC